jgi:predicted solute-binding protein
MLFPLLSLTQSNEESLNKPDGQNGTEVHETIVETEVGYGFISVFGLVSLFRFGLCTLCILVSDSFLSLCLVQRCRSSVAQSAADLSPP